MHVHMNSLLYSSYENALMKGSEVTLWYNSVHACRPWGTLSCDSCALAVEMRGNWWSFCPSGGEGDRETRGEGERGRGGEVERERGREGEGGGERERESEGGRGGGGRVREGERGRGGEGERD